jgi:protein ImuB
MGFVPQRRYLVLTLPDWATDCARRADPELVSPLALYEPVKGALRVAARDRAAAALGIGLGQGLADARALVPELVLREIDRAWLTARFADFADWHSNASPLVAVMPDMAPYGDLALDITGVSHLFGGEHTMLARLTDRLAGIGFTVSGAIASSIGAAWALSHHAPGRVIDPRESDGALAGLPMAGLRLPPDIVAGLARMGLKQIGQLAGRDRRALQARFGRLLIERLDQAHGLLEETLAPRLPVAEHHVERRFAEPIGLMDDVLATAHDLAITLGYRLEAEGAGARTFHLFLYRVDHKVMTLSVNSGRPSREAGHIARLFANRAERLEAEYDPGFGIDMIRLAASSVTDLDASQLGAFDVSEGTADLDRLYDRMTSRLGPLAVVRTKFVDTHIPERAAKLEPVIAPTPDDPRAAPDPTRQRPLRLLPVPEPITVTAEVPDGPPAAMVWRRVRYRFARASGPERIAAEWWRSGKRLELAAQAAPPDPGDPRDGESTKPSRQMAKPPHVPDLALFDAMEATRDYYVAEDDGGRRFWLFRQGLYGAITSPNWYLHGFFA